jgi:hypothetical protein
VPPGLDRPSPADSSTVVGTIEGLIVGHLPVSSSAWVRQYARHLAAGTGRPTALVSLRDRTLSIELVGGVAASVEAGDAGAAVDACASQAGAWLIRLDPADESLLAGVTGLDAVTLLSGADEVAIVGSYRAMKALSGPSGEPPELPGVRLAVMGSAADVAGAAATRLTRVVETYLQTRVPPAVVLPRIGAAAGEAPVLVHRGPIASVAETLAWVVRRIDAARTSARIAVATPGGRSGVGANVDAPPRATTLEVGAEAIDETVPAARRDAAGSSSATSARERVNAARDAGDRNAARTPAGARLTRHAPGLTSLGCLCPLAPRVELAVDTMGVLHLMAWGDSADAVRAALVDLTLAGGWCAAHSAVLSALAERESASLDHEARSVGHLFSVDARALRHVPDASARLHVVIEGDSPRVIDLN